MLPKWFGGVGKFAPDWRAWWYEGTTRPEVLIERWFAMSTWAIAMLTFLATCCLTLALRARTPGRAWTATLCFATSLLVVPPILALIFEDHIGVVSALQLLNPGVGEAFWDQARVPSVVWASVALWFVLSGAAFLLGARKLGERAAR